MLVWSAFVQCARDVRGSIALFKVADKYLENLYSMLKEAMFFERMDT